MLLEKFFIPVIHPEAVYGGFRPLLLKGTESLGVIETICTSTLVRKIRRQFVCLFRGYFAIFDALFECSLGDSERLL